MWISRYTDKLNSAVKNVGEDKLLKLLGERPRSVSELARLLNVRRDYLTGYLEALRDKGQVQRIPVGRSYVYIPTESDVVDSRTSRMVEILEEE